MAADDKDLRELDVQDFRAWWAQSAPARPADRPSGSRMRIAATLTFVALASIAVLALDGGGSSPPKRPLVAAVVDGAATTQPTPGETATASRDDGPSTQENAPPAQVAKAQSPEPETQASLASPPAVDAVPLEAVPPVAPNAATSRSEAQGAPPSTPSPDAKPARTAAPRPYEAPKPPAGSEPEPANGALGVEPAVKPDSPAKHPQAKSPSRVVVAKREAAGPAMAPDTSALALLPEPPVRPDRAAIETGPPQTATDSFPASDAPDDAMRQSVNRVLHTIGGLFGGRSAPAGLSEPASAPAGWAVQLAAPKSEAEARSDLRRLGAQYASALEGSKIDMRKAVVDGETVYRLRVVALSKADAAALCARLKDDGADCFVAR